MSRYFKVLSSGEDYPFISKTIYSVCQNDYQAARFGRGYNWHPPSDDPSFPLEFISELGMLKGGTDFMRKSPDAINSRIDEFEAAKRRHRYPFTTICRMMRRSWGKGSQSPAFQYIVG